MGVRRLVFCLALGVVAVLPAAPASAHILETQNGMSALLHINPYDHPSAGQRTQLLFYFNWVPNQYPFSLSDCRCSATLSGNGIHPITTAVTSNAGSPVIGQAWLTFPRIGVYTVTLAASSKTAAFPDFRLAYPARVETSALPPPPAHAGTDYTEYLILGLGVIGVATLAGWFRWRRPIAAPTRRGR